MSTTTVVLIILVIVITVFIIYITKTHNEFIRIDNNRKDQWSQIEIQLKRRYDLIPNLVECVKGYASHEKKIFTEISEARTKAMNSKTENAKLASNSIIQADLKNIFLIAEKYPDLKASENFKDLQKNLRDTEDKIMYARQFYNDIIMQYNRKIKTFPSSLVPEGGENRYKG